MAGPLDPLLIDTLRDLRSAVNRVQTGQDEMKDRLFEMDDRLDRKLSEAIGPLSTRVSALETGQKDFQAEVKRDARKWGAAGGAGAVITAGLTVLAAILTKVFHLTDK